MGSSPGFGSTSRDSRRPVQTRFRCGCARDWLSLATKRNSPVHSSIGTPSAPEGPSTACEHTVSGTISLPSRGAFHLSLTVLVRYRSLRVFSLGRWAPQLPTRFHRAAWYSGTLPAAASGVGYGALTPSGGPFQGPSPTRAVFDCRRSSPFAVATPYNTPCTEGGDPLGASGLGCSRFARRYYGNCFLSSGYLDVSFPPVASIGPMCSVRGDGVSPPSGCPIRESTDQPA